ncbi:PilZ domain-containing protein [Novosphingobium sp. PS1R-30]|uniref:PilZ domain-containing protein n=1 Tax=Novosphingobium anseongense TaxID=3133436 RepID=A0ABU8S247_9SPHN
MTVFTIRAHKRFAVCRKIRLGKSGRRGVDGLLIELSLDGCRISHASKTDSFALDEPIVLRISGADPIESHVRWLREGVVGLRFARPLHNAGLEALIRLCRSEPVITAA